MSCVTRVHQLCQRGPLHAAAALNYPLGCLSGALVVVVFHGHHPRHRPAVPGD